MTRYKRGVIRLEEISQEDAALLGHFGDEEAFSYLWTLAMGLAGRIAGKFCRRYEWIDHDELTQEILTDFPKIMGRFRPHEARTKGVSWNKYLYFSFYRAAQDALRRQDPLGVRIPQKSYYPSWRRFSEVSQSADILEFIILKGLAKIDRGDPTILDAETTDENNFEARSKRTPEYHDHVYHGKLPWAKGDSP